MEIGATSSSIQGIQNAFAANAAKGKRIANAESDPQFEKDMAELPNDKQDVAANLKVLKTKDAMLGELLDLKA